MASLGAYAQKELPALVTKVLASLQKAGIHPVAEMVEHGLPGMETLGLPEQELHTLSYFALRVSNPMLAMEAGMDMLGDALRKSLNGIVANAASIKVGVQESISSTGTPQQPEVLVYFVGTEAQLNNMKKTFVSLKEGSGFSVQ